MQSTVADRSELIYIHRYFNLFYSALKGRAEVR